jgi:hypothetical protein
MQRPVTVALALTGDNFNAAPKSKQKGNVSNKLHSSPVVWFSDGKTIVSGQSTVNDDVLASPPGGQPPSQGSTKADSK